MKQSAFTKERLTYALRHVEVGHQRPRCAVSWGVSEQTFYRWKRRFAGRGWLPGTACGSRKRRTIISSRTWQT